MKILLEHPEEALSIEVTALTDNPEYGYNLQGQTLRIYEIFSDPPHLGSGFDVNGVCFKVLHHTACGEDTVYEGDFDYVQTLPKTCPNGMRIESFDSILIELALIEQLTKK